MTNTCHNSEYKFKTWFTYSALNEVFNCCITLICTQLCYWGKPTSIRSTRKYNRSKIIKALFIFAVFQAVLLCSITTLTPIRDLVKYYSYPVGVSHSHLNMYIYFNCIQSPNEVASSCLQIYSKPHAVVLKESIRYALLCRSRDRMELRSMSGHNAMCDSLFNLFFITTALCFHTVRWVCLYAFRPDTYDRTCRNGGAKTRLSF